MKIWMSQFLCQAVYSYVLCVWLLCAVCMVKSTIIRTLILTFYPAVALE